MKTRLLIIIGISIFGLLSIVSEENDAFGWCTPNIDWPDQRCYGCPECYPGLEQEKMDFAPYYDYKGSEWMESKKQEMNLAIQNDTLSEWIDLISESQAHHNVHTYYFLQGEVLRHGMTFSESIEYNKVWNAKRDYHPAVIINVTPEEPIFSTELELMDPQPFDISKALVDAKQKAIPQEGYCDETNTGAVCVDRKQWEVKYMGDGIGEWTGTAERMEYLDTGPSPSHANNNLWYFLNSTLPTILFFTLPYIPLWLIEKYKKIPSRSLQKLFLGSTAIYFGGSLSIVLLMSVVNYISNPTNNFGDFGTFIFTFGWIGIPVLALGIVLLYKSPIIRRLLKR